MIIRFPEKQVTSSRREKWIAHLRRVAVDAVVVLDEHIQRQLFQLELQFD